MYPSRTAVLCAQMQLGTVLLTGLAFFMGLCAAQPQCEVVRSAGDDYLEADAALSYHMEWRMEATAHVASLVVRHMYCKDGDPMCDIGPKPNNKHVEALKEWASRDSGWERILSSLSLFELARRLWSQEEYQRAIIALQQSLALKLFAYQEGVKLERWQQALLMPSTVLRRQKIELADTMLLKVDCMVQLARKEKNVLLLESALNCLQLAVALVKAGVQNLELLPETVEDLAMRANSIAWTSADILPRLWISQIHELMGRFNLTCHACAEKSDYLSVLVPQLPLPVLYASKVEAVSDPYKTHAALFEPFPYETLGQYISRLFSRLLDTISPRYLNDLHVPCRTVSSTGSCLSYQPYWVVAKKPIAKDLPDARSAFRAPACLAPPPSTLRYRGGAVPGKDLDWQKKCSFSQGCGMGQRPSQDADSRGSSGASESPPARSAVTSTTLSPSGSPRCSVGGDPHLYYSDVSSFIDRMLTADVPDVDTMLQQLDALGNHRQHVRLQHTRRKSKNPPPAPPLCNACCPSYRRKMTAEMWEKYSCNGSQEDAGVFTSGILQDEGRHVSDRQLQEQLAKTGTNDRDDPIIPLTLCGCVVATIGIYLAAKHRKRISRFMNLHSHGSAMPAAAAEAKPVVPPGQMLTQQKRAAAAALRAALASGDSGKLEAALETGSGLDLDPVLLGKAQVALSQRRKKEKERQAALMARARAAAKKAGNGRRRGHAERRRTDDDDAEEETGPRAEGTGPTMVVGGQAGAGVASAPIRGLAWWLAGLFHSSNRSRPVAGGARTRGRDGVLVDGTGDGEDSAGLGPEDVAVGACGSPFSQRSVSTAGTRSGSGSGDGGVDAATGAGEADAAAALYRSWFGAADQGSNSGDDDGWQEQMSSRRRWQAKEREHTSAAITGGSGRQGRAGRDDQHRDRERDCEDRGRGGQAPPTPALPPVYAATADIFSVAIASKVVANPVAPSLAPAPVAVAAATMSAPAGTHRLAAVAPPAPAPAANSDAFAGDIGHGMRVRIRPEPRVVPRPSSTLNANAHPFLLGPIAAAPPPPPPPPKDLNTPAAGGEPSLLGPEPTLSRPSWLSSWFVQNGGASPGSENPSPHPHSPLLATAGVSPHPPPPPPPPRPPKLSTPKAYPSGGLAKGGLALTSPSTPKGGVTSTPQLALLDPSSAVNGQLASVWSAAAAAVAAAAGSPLAASSPMQSGTPGGSSFRQSAEDIMGALGHLIGRRDSVEKAVRSAATALYPPAATPSSILSPASTLGLWPSNSIGGECADAFDLPVPVPVGAAGGAHGEGQSTPSQAYSLFGPPGAGPAASSGFASGAVSSGYGTLLAVSPAAVAAAAPLLPPPGFEAPPAAAMPNSAAMFFSAAAPLGEVTGGLTPSSLPAMAAMPDVSRPTASPPSTTALHRYNMFTGGSLWAPDAPGLGAEESWARLGGMTGWMAAPDALVPVAQPSVDLGECLGSSPSDLTATADLAHAIAKTVVD